MSELNQEISTEIPKENQEEKAPFGEDLIIITDANLSEEIYGSYQGFKFNCPVCRLPSIMVNDDLVSKGIGVCLKCHRKVLIRSNAVEKDKKLREESASTQTPS